MKDMLYSFPSLSYLFDAYLSQDFDLVADTLEGVVTVFIEEADRPLVEAVRSDVTRLLDMPGNLDDELDRLAPGRSRSTDEDSRTYLTWILVQLDQALAGDPAAATKQVE